MPADGEALPWFLQSSATSLLTHFHHWAWLGIAYFLIAWGVALVVGFIAFFSVWAWLIEVFGIFGLLFGWWPAGPLAVIFGVMIGALWLPLAFVWGYRDDKRQRALAARPAYQPFRRRA